MFNRSYLSSSRFQWRVKEVVRRVMDILAKLWMQFSHRLKRYILLLLLLTGTSFLVFRNINRTVNVKLERGVYNQVQYTPKPLSKGWLEVRGQESRVKVNTEPAILQLTLPETQGGRGNPAIIIASYLRSGSTFTADMLHQSEDVFYMYEPLRAFGEGYFKPSKICRNFNNSCIDPIGWRSDPRVVMRTLSRILSCDLSKVPAPVIRIARLKYPTSKDYRALYKCAKTVHDLVPCVTTMETTCRRKVRVVKTIRVSMELLSRFLPSFPDLKIILLLRDPRGVMMSRMKGNFVNGTVLEQMANVTCSRMYNDLIWALQLQQYYPIRIKIMLYEAIAEQPMKALEKLYKFANLRVSDKVRKYVFNHTAAGNRSNGYYRTVRSNSTETAHAWRKRISWDLARSIDSSCGLLYETIGLIPFTSASEISDPEFLTRKKFTTMFGDFL